MKADLMETANYKGIPAMSPPEVHEYLNEIGRGWTGAGVAMEIGCWHGATSAALLEGLVEAGYDKPYWAFDRWRANPSEARKAAEQGVEIQIGQDLSPVFHRNVAPVYPNLKQVQGKVPHRLHQYKEEPIEICLFDAPKKNPVFMECIRFCEPMFIPGVTILGLMDYYFYRSRRDVQKNNDWVRFLAPVKFIDTYKEHFTMLREFPDNGSCVFFKYEKPISWKQ
jgi:hypothetical protein